MVKPCRVGRLGRSLDRSGQVREAEISELLVANYKPGLYYRNRSSIADDRPIPVSELRVEDYSRQCEWPRDCSVDAGDFVHDSKLLGCGSKYHNKEQLPPLPDDLADDGQFVGYGYCEDIAHARHDSLTSSHTNGIVDPLGALGEERQYWVLDGAVQA